MRLIFHPVRTHVFYMKPAASQCLSGCFWVIMFRPWSSMRSVSQPALILMWPLLLTPQQCNAAKLMTCSTASPCAASHSRPHREPLAGGGVCLHRCPSVTSMKYKANGSVIHGGCCFFSVICFRPSRYIFSNINRKWLELKLPQFRMVLV